MQVEGDVVLLGNRRLMDEQKIDLGALADEGELLEGASRTLVHAARGDRLHGVVVIADAPRPAARATGAKLCASAVCR